MPMTIAQFRRAGSILPLLVCLLACLLVSGILVLPATAGAVPGPNEKPYLWQRPKEGKMLRVSLFAAAHGIAKPLEKRMEKAEDGVMFYFLLEKMEGKDGQLSLKELKDFSINGRSYQTLTEEKLGYAITPQTVLEDVSDFRKGIGPGLRSKIQKADDKRAIIMIVCIAGAELPRKGMITFDLFLGLEKKVEPFSYALDLAQIDISSSK